MRNLPPRFKEITPELLKKDIDDFLKEGEESQLYHWQPRQQNHRIIAQQSIFLFGSYKFDPDDECVIAGDSKENILKELQKISGITEDRLFPDFEGFARVRSEEAPYTELTPSAYKNRGFLAYERGDYKDAIVDYDVAIDKDPNDAEVYYLRGLARESLEQSEAAIVNFDNAIRLDPEHTKAYYWRGYVKGSLGRYEAAIVDFDVCLIKIPNMRKPIIGVEPRNIVWGDTRQPLLIMTMCFAKIPNMRKPIIGVEPRNTT